MKLFTLLLFMAYLNLYLMQDIDVHFDGRNLFDLRSGSVLVDDFLYLSCDLDYESVPSIRNVTISFIKDGRILTSDDEFIDEEFRSRNRPPTLQFSGSQSVLYFGVTRDDGGYYECCAFDGDYLENERINCDGERIEVKYSPVPTCTPPGEARVHLGEQAILSCVSEGGNIPVELKWSNENSINSTAMSNETIARENAFNVASDLTLSTSETDVNDVYTCEAAFEEYSYLSRWRRCTIYVKTIWPTLSLYPNEAVVNLNNDVIFTCHFPYLKNYTTDFEWTTEPPINQSRISTSDNGFTVFDVTMTDNDTIVTCFALFQNRWLQDTAILHVITPMQDPAVTINPNRATMTTGKRSSGSNCGGWKAAFSVIFTALVAAIGVIIFLYLKLRNISKPSANVATIYVTAADEKGQTNDLEEHSYMDLKSPTKDNNPGMANVDSVAKNDCIYENEELVDVGDSHQNGLDDSIYDYAETKQ